MGKWTSTFESIGGMVYELTIENSQITNGTITLSADPLHLKSPEYDTKYPGLRSTELEINILTKTDLFELYTSDPLGTKVTLTEDTDVIFVGFIEPNQYSMPCIPGKINEMQVVAIDALSALKQYTMQSRKAQYMYEWKNEMLNILETAGITHTWSIPFTRAVISNDALMPDDLYADGVSEKFGTYGELLNEIGKAYNYTFMMVGNVVRCYNVDEQTTTATIGTPISATMEVVPAKRYITAKFDKYPQIDQPALLDKSSPTGILYPNSTVYTRDTYDGKYVALWHAQRYAQKYWENYGAMPEHNISPIMGVNYADELKDLSTSQPAWMVGVSGISSKVRPIVSGTEKELYISIEADVHINEQLSDSNNWDIVPRLWKSTKPEVSATSSTSNSTIALKVGDTVVNPIRVSTDYWASDNSNQEWQHCVYGFRTTATAFQVIVRSPQAGTSSGKGYSYAKNIKIYYSTDPELSKTVTASGEVAAEDLDIDNSLNSLFSQTHGYTVAPLSETGTSHDTTATMNALAAQYSKPRRKIAIKHYGYVDQLAKVSYNSRIYTQLSFDNDLLNEQQTLTILESKEND